MFALPKDNFNDSDLDDQLSGEMLFGNTAYIGSRRSRVKNLWNDLYLEVNNPRIRGFAKEVIDALNTDQCPGPIDEGSSNSTESSSTNDNAGIFNMILHPIAANRTCVEILIDIEDLPTDINWSGRVLLSIRGQSKSVSLEFRRQGRVAILISKRNRALRYSELYSLLGLDSVRSVTLTFSRISNNASSASSEVASPFGVQPTTISNVDASLETPCGVGGPCRAARNIISNIK
jgi:hypothetical protein